VNQRIAMLLGTFLTAPAGEHGMSLWQLLQAGGGTMILLLLLSVVGLSFVVYFFLYYREERLVPEAFAREVIEKLAARNYAAARETAAEREDIVARVVTAGLDRSARGGAAMREAAEVTAKLEVSKLWENLSYLSDIAVIAPLIGLLGTVFGMIQSFNVIAFQTAAAKPVLLAGGIAKAMVATAGGLIIAIPASIFYSVFRSRIFKITGKIETYVGEILNLLKD